MLSEAAVVNKLKKIDEYQTLLAEAFKDDKEPFKYNNIGKAIGAFERTFLTPSRFDDFLKGDKNALNQDKKEA